MNLINGFVESIPGEGLDLYASDHDKGNIILGEDQKRKAAEHIEEGICKSHLRPRLSSGFGLLILWVWARLYG